MNHCVLVRVDTCHSLLPLFDDVARGEESETEVQIEIDLNFS